MNDSLVKISIHGKNPNLFIKRLLSNNIKFNKLRKIRYDNIELIISYEDYLKIIDKNTIYEINIIKYYGLLKYVFFLKENLSFVFSFIISLILLLIMSNTCFDIEIVHNDTKIRKLVKIELEENGIKEYRFIPNFNKRKKIIDRILKYNKDELEWLEIERKGSKLIVKLTERKLNKKPSDNSYRDIVAKKSGIIKKVEASSGVILKKINDYIKQGETIVSGNITKDDVIKGQVKARGVVYAETWYNVNVVYPLYYEEVKYLDEVKNNIIFKFMNKNYALKKNYESSYLEKNKVLIKNKIFPFEMSIQKQRKTKTIKEKLTIKEARKKAEDIAIKKMNNKLSKDEYIISKKTLNFNVNDSKIEVDVFLKVYENITDYKILDEAILDAPKEE